LQSQLRQITFHSTLAAMVLATVTVELRAQSEGAATTQPAAATQPAAENSRAVRSAWSGTVTAFASALLDASDTANLNTIVTEDAIVRQFNHAGRQSLTALREQVAGTHVIVSRSYMQTPNTLASDIANAIKDVTLPDEIKRRLTPGDEATLKRANLTANKWIGASLFTSGSEPVAIVVLWKEGTRPAITESTSGDDKDGSKPVVQINLPVFILLKGEMLGDRMQVTQICFGDPLPFSAPTSADEDTAASGD